MQPESSERTSLKSSIVRCRRQVFLLCSSQRIEDRIFMNASPPESNVRLVLPASLAHYQGKVAVQRFTLQLEHLANPVCPRSQGRNLLCGLKPEYGERGLPGALLMGFGRNYRNPVSGRVTPSPFDDTVVKSLVFRDIGPESHVHPSW